jgi:hypothetical protein
MSEQYVHMLIAHDPGFAPAPEQIVAFFDGLASIGASPTSPKLILMKPSGRLRFFTDPLTGEKKSFPAHDRVVLGETADLAPLIQPLQEYFVSLDGQGPTQRPPFMLYHNAAPFEGEYGFSVHCRLRAEPVCTSDLPKFGQACSALGEAGVFRNPESGAVIEVAGAGCARFWIEFEFGKWLLPKIGVSLDILELGIVALTNQAFAMEFAQGLHLL